MGGTSPAAGARRRAPLTFLSVEWPVNLRVGANSPSRWPTMFSVTYTGMNSLPLCTWKVSPTMSGVIIERRDQVLITCFEPPARACVDLALRLGSTNGPFLSERAMPTSSLAA